MDLGVPAGDLVWPILALLAGGLVMGTLAGLLGIGGGGILVPILYEAFGVIGVDEAIRMHMCIGTSLAVIIPTSLRSFRAHYKRGAVDMDVVRSMAVPVVLGVGIGSLIVSVVDADMLTAIWITCAGLMAIKFFFGRETWRLGDHLPGQPFRTFFGLFIGTIATLMSIGGAAFITAWMTLYNRPINQAIATSSGFGPMVAVPGTIGFIWAGWNAPGLPPGSLGYVSLLGAAVIIPASVLAAPFGVRMAHGIPRRWLELAFAFFLTAISVRLLLTLI